MPLWIPREKLRGASNEYSAIFGRDPIGRDPNNIGRVESNTAKNYHYQ
jgi:hypothetical protein